MIKQKVGILLMLLLSLTAQAQWEPTGGPLGGTASAILHNSGQLMATTEGVAVYTSANNGSTWTSRRFYNGTTPTQILRAPGGRIILNNTGSNYVYSDDNGLTWNTDYPLPFTTTNTGYYLFGNVLFRSGYSSSWATNNIGVSLDSGKTWIARNGLGNFFTGITVYGFAHIGSRLFLASRNGVYMSADTGNTWALRNGPSGFTNTNEINYISASGSRLFVYNTWGNAFTSADSGQTWTSIPRKFTTIYEYKGYILGATTGADTLYRFNTTINNWEAHSWQLKRLYGQAFTSNGDTLYMAGTNGVYYSLNNGVNWTICTGALNSLRTKSLAAGNIVLALDDNGNLHRSENEGASWSLTSQKFSYGANSAYTFSMTKTGMVVLSFYGQFYLSADTGRTWRLQSGITISKGGFFAGNKFVYSTFDRIYLSSDTGRTAVEITNNISTQLLNNLSFLDEINGEIWLCSRKQGIFKSADAGQTWLKYNSGIPSYTGNGAYDTSVYWVVKVGNTLVARLDSANGMGRHYISYNNGQNWQYRSSDYSSGWVTPFVRGRFVALDNYLSTDTFATVVNFNGGIGFTPYSSTYQTISGISGGNNYLFGNYGSFGVWRRSITSVGVPPAPISVNGTALNQTTVKLSWTPHANVTRIELQESSNPTSGFGALNNIYNNIGNDTLTQRSALSAGTTRYYRIVAFNESGQTTGPVLTLSTMPRPLEPTVFVATGVSTTQVLLRWQRRETTAIKYYIERTPGSTCCTYNLIDSVNATDTTYVVNGLTRNSTYYFRVRCVDAGGYSNYSGNITGRTLDTLPKRPVNLVATALSQYAVNLQWVDSADNETNFIIQRKDSATGTFVSIDSTAANSQSRTISGLKANTKYWFRVMAKNTGGYSLPGNIDSAVTYPAPLAPTGLTISNVATVSVTLSWIDNSTSETGYVIERATSATGVFFAADSVGANVTSRTLNNLAPSTRYFFRVRTRDAYGYSTYSNVVDSITLPTAPVAPSNLFATTQSQSAISINWSDNAFNEDKYYVELSLSPASGFTLFDSVSANISSYTATGLQAGTYYYFRVRAYNAGGFSAYTNPVMGITSPAIPQSPENLQVAQLTTTWVKLTWVDNSGNETGFVLQRALGSGTFVDFKNYASGATVGYDSTIAAGQTFRYRLYAYNSTGSSTYSNEVQIVAPIPVGSAPQNVTATTINYHTIRLSWTDVSTGVSRYIIERKQGNGPYMAIDSVGGAQEIYLDNALLAATTYTYRIRSYVDNVGYSAYSAEASAPTANLPIGFPLPPNSLRVTSVTNNSITMSWRDSSDNERKFYIERFKSGIGFELIDSVEQNVTTYTASGLGEGTTYTFRVVAVNSLGYSPYSNQVSTATTIDLAAPKGLYAELRSTYEVTLNWQDISSGEDKVIVERSLVANDAFQMIAELPANSTTYDDVLTEKGTFYYRVRMKKGSGYSGYSNIAAVANIRTGVGVIETNNVSAYPNPFERYLTISGIGTDMNLAISDVSGIAVPYTSQRDFSGTLVVDFSQLPAGIYFVTVSETRIKVVKQ